jgi:heme-degrading monooxygenase HmoA
MFMTIRHYRVPPSKMQEVVRRVDEVWLSKLSKLPGFESYYVTQPDDSHLTSVSAFIEEAAGRKAAEASAEWVGSYLADLDVEFLEMWQGPVVVHGGE